MQTDASVTIRHGDIWHQMQTDASVTIRPLILTPETDVLAPRPGDLGIKDPRLLRNCNSWMIEVL
jgi:hypothetical protein